MGQVFSFVGVSHTYMVIVIINNHVEQELALISHISIHIRFGNSNTLARAKRNKKEASHLDRQQIFHLQMRKSKAGQTAKGISRLFYTLFRKGLPFFITVLLVVTFGTYVVTT